MRRGLVLPFALAVASLGLAAPASAVVTKSGGFRYVTKQFAVDAEVTKTLKVPCPDGTHVYSGGYYNTASFDSGFGLHSFPYDDGDRRKKPDDGWKSRVTTRNPPKSWLAYAICAKPMPTYLRDDQSVAGGGGTITVTPTCEPGLNVFSGGTRGHDLVTEVQSYPTVNPTLRQWTVKLVSTSIDSSRLDFYAVCADLPAHYRSFSNSVPADTQENQTSPCPVERERVLGGGVSTNAIRGDLLISASRPVGLSPTEVDGWEAYLDNYDINSTGEAATFFVHSVCTDDLN